MKQPCRVRLDFVAPVQRARAAGAALCAMGVAAALGVGLLFSGELAERNRLDAALGALARPARPATAAAARAAEDAAGIERELSIPWSQLLAELEAAGRDTAASVSVLRVEPDPAKRVVRITAEARTLPEALGYLERLQLSKLLRFPMLESHEYRKDDAQHPVRVKLAAEWRT